MGEDRKAAPGAESTGPQRRMLELLSVHPSPVIDVRTAAALAGLGQDEAAELLEALVAAGVLRRSGAAYEHGLVRGRGAEEMDVEEVQAFGRLVEELLQVGAAAQLAMTPGWYLGRQFYREPPVIAFTAGEALDWMDAHLPELVRVQEVAYELDSYPQVWGIAETCAGVLGRRKRYRSWAALYGLGRQAASVTGFPAAQTLMCVGLANLHLELGEPTAAAEVARAALQLEREHGHEDGEAPALQALGAAALAVGNLDDAGQQFTAARAIYEKVGEVRGVALLTREQGRVMLAAGRIEEAHGLLTTALHRFVSVAPEPYEQAGTLLLLARVHLAEDNVADAGLALGTVMDLSQKDGWPAEEADARAMLAVLADRRGEPGLAAEHRRIAGGIEAALAEARRAVAARSEENPAAGAHHTHGTSPRDLPPAAAGGSSERSDGVDQGRR